MVRFKSQPQRALKQEPPKSGDNQPTILIVQNVTCLPYSSTHSQGPQSVLKATVPLKSVSDTVDERYIHPLASHPEIPKLTDLQVLITMAILQHGEPCPFEAIYQFISKKWKGVKIRRRDGTPYISDCRRAILANLRSTPSHICLFRKVGDAGYRLVRDIEEALSFTKDRRVKESKSESEPSKDQSKGSATTSQIYLTRSQTKSEKKRNHYFEMENGFSEEDDETNDNESDSCDTQTGEAEDTNPRPRKRNNNNNNNNNNNYNNYNNYNNNVNFNHNMNTPLDPNNINNCYMNFNNYQAQVAYQMSPQVSTYISGSDTAALLLSNSSSAPHPQSDLQQFQSVPNFLVQEPTHVSELNVVNNNVKYDPLKLENHLLSVPNNSNSYNTTTMSLPNDSRIGHTESTVDSTVHTNGTLREQFMSESNNSTSSIPSPSYSNTIPANKSRSDETTAKSNESSSLVLTELQRLISMAIVLSKSSEFVPLAQIQEYVGKFWGEMKGANGQPRHTDHKRAVSACLTRIYHGKYLFTRNPKDLYSWKLSKDHPWVVNPSLNPLNTSNNGTNVDHNERDISQLSNEHESNSSTQSKTNPNEKSNSTVTSNNNPNLNNDAITTTNEMNENSCSKAESTESSVTKDLYINGSTYNNVSENSEPTQSLKDTLRSRVSQSLVVGYSTQK